MCIERRKHAIGLSRRQAFLSTGLRVQIMPLKGHIIGQDLI
jgi:hypothetical protein